MSYLYALISVFLFSAPAFAKRKDSLQESSLNLSGTPLVKELNVLIPVSWEINRSGFTENGVASESESYQENWTYIQQRPYGFYLESPRARVPVVAFENSDVISKTPDTLAISKQSLASLLGLKIAVDGNIEQNYDFFLEHPSEVIFLKTKTDSRELQIQLTISANQSFGISMKLH